MKRIIFTLVMAFTASMMWAQTSGLTISYRDGSETKEQTFNLDSVQSYGYNPTNQTVFVQPAIGATFGVPYQNLLAFTYPLIVADSTGGSSDYFVVNVNGQKAAFLLAEGFEMTWKGGVLAIKDRKQSQSIGLKNGISFSIEQLSFGYTNPNIASTPGSGSWYVVVEYNGTLSYSDKCSLSYHATIPLEHPALRFTVSDRMVRAISIMYGWKGRKSYMSPVVIGELHE